MINMSPSSPSRVAITGASGRLGGHLCLALSNHYDVIALSHQHAVPEDLCSFKSRLDLLDSTCFEVMLDNMKPTAVVHAAALSDPNTCENRKDHSLSVNVDVPKHLAKMCSERNIGFYFISTDLVFDGEKGHYKESDSVNPINTYGEHKAMAEELICELHSSPIIFRLPWMFGHPVIGESSLKQWAVQLKQGQALMGFTDEYRSAVSYSVAAEGIAELVVHFENLKARLGQVQEAQVFHLGGIETVSRFHFLCQMAELLHCSTELIHGQTQKEAIMPAKRPSDVTLDSRKARSLGYKTPFLNEMLKDVLTHL